MFINMYRNPKTRNWFRYETFIQLFEFKGFSTWGERETQSFYADCFYIVSSQPNQQAVAVAHKFVCPHPALNLNSFVRTQELNSTFSQISAHASAAWSHSHPLVTIAVWDFYFEWHILSSRAWTPMLMLHLTNPCAKRKVLCLTKPKGKIYKIKSLRNYVTLRMMIQIPMKTIIGILNVSRKRTP